MDTKGLEALIEDCEAMVATRVDALKGGNIDSFDKYKDLCGQIRGLLLAIDTAKSLLRNIQEE